MQDIPLAPRTGTGIPTPEMVGIDAAAFLAAYQVTYTDPLTQLTRDYEFAISTLHAGEVAKRKSIDDAYFAARNNIMMQQRAAALQNSAQVAGALAGLIGVIAGKNKALFLLMQGMRVAETIMSSNAAVLAGMATTPYAMWPAVIAQAKIMGAIAVATIMAQTAVGLKGQAHSGLTNVPSTGTYLLEGGEAIIPKAYNPFTGADSGGGAITVNVDFSRAYINDRATAVALSNMVEESVKRGWSRREVH